MHRLLGLFILAVIPVSIFVGVLWRADQVSQLAVNTPLPVSSASPLLKPCTPTFVDGGGPYYQMNAPFRDRLAPEFHTGEELTVSGKVLASDCLTPMANVIVDVWQANESGSYEDAWYRGQVQTNDQGEYRFTTVVPKGYGEGTGYRPPHIHFKIWQGTRELITSQMFMPASRAQGIEEAFIMKIVTSEANGVKTHQGYHDIILP